MELEETDALRGDLRLWKNSDVVNNRPTPMIIETFLDTGDLTNNQSLVIVDDHDKRWDVEDALRSFTTSNNQNESRNVKSCVILERWRIELGDAVNEPVTDLGVILPRIYKNSIVLFRSLYAYAKFLPAWRFGKKLSKHKSSHNLPRLKYRILEHEKHPINPDLDGLALPLFDGHECVTEDFSFAPIDSPAGPFSIKVSYRRNCDFRIDNSEALLSSHFIGIDEDLFEPSLGHTSRGSPQQESNSRRTEMGSLPPARKNVAERPDLGQAYGSLSTFHHAGAPMSSSPLSALRAARDLNQSPSSSPSAKLPPNHRSSQGSRSSLRSVEGAPVVGRRPSVSFMPFKTPSLSASPLQNENLLVSSPRGSIGRTSALGVLAEARNPSLIPNSTVSSRVSPTTQETAAVASASSSPKPAPVARYSSSFGHRRARLSTGGGSKTDDDNNSSGKASLTSSAAQPGSGVLAEGGGGSSSSVHTDDDNISDFLKMLDQKKDLKSFQTPTNSVAAEASSRRTIAALSKFQKMRDSNAALSDSMSSSLLLHRSSSSSSRQLSSVPPMVAGTSTSISSSPGNKPVSPHTPHTPAIPSRLSANSIIEYNHRDAGTGRHRLSNEEDSQPEEVVTGSYRDRGTGAIDIPTSPRAFHPSYRRSSSVAQHERVMPINDDLGDLSPFGMRSASLGADERPPLPISALMNLQEADIPIPMINQQQQHFGPVVDPNGTDMSMGRRQSTSLEAREEGNSTPSRGVPYRPRLGGGTGRGQTPPQGSTGSLGGERGSGSGSSDQRGGRYSFTRPASNFEEEEPLLFAMSDFGAIQQSRRSLEEGSGASDALIERPECDPNTSPRRGNRRGGAHTWI